MAKIRLLLDENVRPPLAEILRQRSYDVIHVAEIRRGGITDVEQLDFAVSQQRTILTHNIRDFVALDRNYRETDKEHFGIVMSVPIPLRELLPRSLRFLNRHDTEVIRNTVLWLTE